MSQCVHYPALYDVGETGCYSAKCVVPTTPAAPVPTWGEIVVTFPHGCVLETHICWDVEFDRGASTIEDVADAGATDFILPASYAELPIFGHSADYGYGHPWQGLAVTKYELLIDGDVWATTLASIDYGTAGCGPYTITPAPTCVTLTADHHPDWSAPHDVTIRAYYNDVPRFIAWCYPPGSENYTCLEDGTHSVCAEEFRVPQEYRKANLCDGFAAGVPGAFGNFGSAVPCTTCDCTAAPDPCGVSFPNNWDRWDFESIDYTFESDPLTVQCPIPFCEDFEDCGSAPEERFGTADCASTGFYCSPTHVLQAQLSGHVGNYWRHEAISSLAPVYLAAVLWLPPAGAWTLPPGFSIHELVLAAEGDSSDPNPYFEGASLYITTGADGSTPTVVLTGAYGRLGSTYNVFGDGVELCLGEPNCLQVRYWAGDGTISPTPANAVGIVIGNGVEAGREVRVRNATDTPHAEGVIFGAIEADAVTDALVDSIYLDDVCYGQAGWINCACDCTPEGGNVFLTRAVAPEEADGGWSPPSATGIVNLRGVSAGAEGES